MTLNLSREMIKTTYKAAGILLSDCKRLKLSKEEIEDAEDCREFWREALIEETRITRKAAKE